MAVADRVEDAKSAAGSETPLVGFISTVAALLEAGDYRTIAERFAALVAGDARLDYMASEAIPAKVSDHIIKKTGKASAFTTYTLRHPTWAVDLKRAAGQPEKFAAMVEAIEAEVKEIAAKAPKLR